VEENDVYTADGRDDVAFVEGYDRREGGESREDYILIPVVLENVLNLHSHPLSQREGHETTRDVSD
jgi:hypothetical protein